MTCVKTGCDVYLTSHRCTLHGDMFKVSDVFIFHHCAMDIADYESPRECADYIFGVDSTGDTDVVECYCEYMDTSQIIAMDDAFVEVRCV